MDLPPRNVTGFSENVPARNWFGGGALAAAGSLRAVGPNAKAFRTRPASTRLLDVDMPRRAGRQQQAAPIGGMVIAAIKPWEERLEPQLQILTFGLCDKPGIWISRASQVPATFVAVAETDLGEGSFHLTCEPEMKRRQ